MTESQFINENKEVWQSLEKLLQSRTKDPTKLSSHFTKVSGDLAFAQTYFPRRSVTSYLNDLVTRLYDSMKTKKSYHFWRSINNYFGHILPVEIIRNRKAFLISLMVFSVAMLIGIYSTIENPDFPTIILGEEYVELTNENIEKGDPMAIYKSGTRWDSFIGITINNIRVAFLAFVLGIIGTLGTYFIMIKNGIMVGAFQTMFFQKGLLSTSMLTIWIHGTIEISSIIVAGAAGLILGNSLLFPGSYSRLDSLKNGAMRSMLILLSTVPLFIIAGCFEGFVTPLTNLNNGIKIAIIAFSVLFIVFFYIVNPYMYYRSGKYSKNAGLAHKTQTQYHKDQLSFNDSPYRQAFFRLSQNIGVIASKIVLPIFIIVTLLMYIFIRNSEFRYIDYGKDIFSFSIGGPFFWSVIFLGGLIFFASMYCLEKFSSISTKQVTTSVKKYFLPFTILTLITIVPYYFILGYWKYFFIFLVPPTISVYTLKEMQTSENSILSLITGVKYAYEYWASHFIDYLLIGFGFLLASLTFDVLFVQVFNEILGWHTIMEDEYSKAIFLNSLSLLLFWLIFLPVAYFILKSRANFIRNKYTSEDLLAQTEIFGSKST